MTSQLKALLRPPAVAAVLAAEHAVAARRMGRARTEERGSTWRVEAFYAKPNGLTRGAQLQVDSMGRAGVPTSPGSAGPADGGLATGAGSNLVLHSGAPECARLINGLALPPLSVYPIGYWAWELPDPPRDWKRYQGLVSEIWTPSTFSAASLRRLFDIPVYVVPHRVAPEPRRARDPDSIFTVLTMADSRSSFDRKNPIGAVSAFRRAFGDRSDVRLIVKLLGRPSEVSELVNAVGGASNIEFLTETLGLDELRALFRQSDVLLSLHRAEGFGLPILEAMAHGTPAVATGWSGNLDFMGPDDGILVPYRLVDVRDRAGVYRHRSQWADPDVEYAATALRELADDPVGYASLSRAAHKSAQQLVRFASPWHEHNSSSGADCGESEP
ncbi:glycosyltransferase family 4 protein [Actinomycetospora atypica]|uniref:Glycosyltransferase family 4 protein n=1 Tax=Actinomycetospora atypica TaxID=1290095 RepID=A0ABV9YM84_9PSEU